MAVPGLPSNINDIIAADPNMGPLMANLLMCLCEKAALNPNPPQHCTFRIGQQPPHDLGIDTDFCCEGMAYVTMGDVFPTADQFPQQDVTRLANTNCIPVSWAVTLKAALVRCVPTGDENGVTIKDSAWEAAALQGIYDIQTLQRTSCCFRDYVLHGNPLLIGMSAVFDRITTSEPEGGCVERALNFTVQIPDCSCL